MVDREDVNKYSNHSQNVVFERATFPWSPINNGWMLPGRAVEKSHLRAVHLARKLNTYIEYLELKQRSRFNAESRKE